MMRLPKRPDWWDDAACRGKDPALFFPGPGQTTKAAKAICANCPVLHDCDDWAMGEGPWLRGIFAGQTDTERRTRLRGAA